VADTARGWLGVGMLAALLSLVITGCGAGSDDSGERADLTLRAQSLTGGPVERSELDRAVAVLEARLHHAGIDGTVTQRPGSQVSVQLDDPLHADRVVELSTSIGLLEFYELESNLVTPSLDDNGFPVATDSLYDLLVGRQSPALEDEVDNWYLFDPDKNVAGGPVATKQLLLPAGTLRVGWRILGTPGKTVVLECGIGEIVCPGVDAVNPTRDYFYLVRYDPPATPELDGGDLQLQGTRQDVDTITGEPIVIIRFADRGAERFAGITHDLAVRGKQASLTLGGGERVTHHFAIVLDREIKSWPSIDWQQYPNGISGTNGAQITGIGDLQEAKDLALVLQTGALPVRFEVVSRG
jgi:preprotein translocase subunit SecD